MAIATTAAICTIVGAAITSFTVGATYGDDEWDFENLKKDMERAARRSTYVHKSLDVFEFYHRDEWKALGRGYFVETKDRSRFVAFRPHDGLVRNTWTVTICVKEKGRWRRISRTYKNSQCSSFFDKRYMGGDMASGWQPTVPRSTREHRSLP